MSEMQIQAAMRFNLGKFETKNTIEELTKIFGKSPDTVEEYDGNVEYFEYDPKLNDGFAVRIINDILYADYMILDEDDQGGFDLDITKERIEDILSKINAKGLSYSSYKIKVLYFYNGGCAGLSEIC